jgi:hypothetical protein
MTVSRYNEDTCILYRNISGWGLKAVTNPSIRFLAGKKLDELWECHLLWPPDRSADTEFPLHFWNVLSLGRQSLVTRTGFISWRWGWHLDRRGCNTRILPLEIVNLERYERWITEAEMKCTRRTAVYTCSDYKKNFKTAKELNAQSIMEFIENYKTIKKKNFLRMPCSRIPLQILC